jgi:hypothetical protein
MEYENRLWNKKIKINNGENIHCSYFVQFLIHNTDEKTNTIAMIFVGFSEWQGFRNCSFLHSTIQECCPQTFVCVGGGGSCSEDS